MSVKSGKAVSDKFTDAILNKMTKSICLFLMLIVFGILSVVFIKAMDGTSCINHRLYKKRATDKQHYMDRKLLEYCICIFQSILDHKHIGKLLCSELFYRLRLSAICNKNNIKCNIQSFNYANNYYNCNCFFY